MAACKKLHIIFAGCLRLYSCKCSNKEFRILTTTHPKDTFADGCLHSGNSGTLFEAFLLHGNNRHSLMSWKYSGFAAWSKARKNNKNKLLLCDTKITIVHLQLWDTLDLQCNWLRRVEKKHKPACTNMNTLNFTNVTWQIYMAAFTITKDSPLLLSTTAGTKLFKYTQYSSKRYKAKKILLERKLTQAVHRGPMSFFNWNKNYWV